MGTEPKLQPDILAALDFYLYAPPVLVALGALLWVYGKDWPRPARSYAWLGCALLATIAAIPATVLVLFVGAMTANHTGGDGVRALVVGFVPLIVVFLVVAVSARGRAGGIPSRERLTRMLALTALAVTLILTSYVILSSR